jgi:excisionase family DNA binding protein
MATRSNPAAVLEPEQASDYSKQLEVDLHPAEQPAKLRGPASATATLGPRLALSPEEAAALLGVSRDCFDEHVIAELRIVRRGRRILIALAELERWLDRAATRPAHTR